MNMKEIRIHGRGGDGAVTFAHTLGLAATYDGKAGQSCQGMTPLRRGAPIEGYARVGDKEVVERGVVVAPDYVVILNANVIGGVAVESGMPPDGHIMINSDKPLTFEHNSDYFDGTSLALEIIGTSTPNNTMLGAFAACTGLVSIEALEKATPEIMGHKVSSEVIEKNIKAMRAAYDRFKQSGGVS